MKTRYIIAICLVYILSSCNKEQLLNEKPSSNIVVPKTLSDFTLLLDNYPELNVTSALPILSADEYFYQTKSEYQSAITATERNSYLWAKDAFGGEINRKDWNKPFETVFYANVVLDEFSKLSLADQNSANGNLVKGWALFIRAFSYNNLAESFTKPYNSTTASEDLGLPLKLNANIDEIKQRSSLQATYDQILSDCKLAASALPAEVPVNNKNRPSKPAAYALLSRIYLNMHNYTNASKYADSALQLSGSVLDYNDVSKTSSRPFSINYGEILFSSRIHSDYAATYVGSSAISKIDTNLIKSYEGNDLRKVIFFNVQLNGNKVNYFIKRGYSNSNAFTGLAIDELYLIKAECLARDNQLNDAENFLNELLNKRYVKGTYIPFHASSQQVLLDKIFLERRKELVFRGTRWADLRRLNVEGLNIKLTRNLDGIVYTLAPNDSRYVMNIPQDEINLSHIIQNIR